MMANTMEAPWWVYYQRDIYWEHLTFISLDDYNNMPNHLEPSYLETYPGNIYSFGVAVKNGELYKIKYYYYGNLNKEIIINGESCVKAEYQLKWGPANKFERHLIMKKTPFGIDFYLHSEIGPARINYKSDGEEFKKISSKYYLNGVWLKKNDWQKQIKTKLYW